MSSIKLTREQRRTIQRAASLIDGAQVALDDVHTELCDKLGKGSPARQIETTAATSEVYRVLCVVLDTLRTVEHLAAKPPRRKKRRRR